MTASKTPDAMDHACSLRVAGLIVVRERVRHGCRRHRRADPMRGARQCMGGDGIRHQDEEDDEDQLGGPSRMIEGKADHDQYVAQGGRLGAGLDAGVGVRHAHEAEAGREQEHGARQDQQASGQLDHGSCPP